MINYLGFSTKKKKEKRKKKVITYYLLTPNLSTNKVGVYTHWFFLR